MSREHRWLNLPRAVVVFAATYTRVYVIKRTWLDVLNWLKIWLPFFIQKQMFNGKYNSHCIRVPSDIFSILSLASMSMISSPARNCCFCGDLHSCLCNKKNITRWIHGNDWKYEFNFLVGKTLFRFVAAFIRIILFLPLENEFNVFFQFFVVTRRGATGVCVASHVTEELRLALVHAPVPRQHTEDEVAANLDQFLKQEDAKRTRAQVRFLAQNMSYNVITRLLIIIF